MNGLSGVAISKVLTGVAAPFWIGLAVTFIAAAVTLTVLSELKESSFLPDLKPATRKRLIQRLTRDFDAVQSAASLVSVAASALLLVHLDPTEELIICVLGAALVIMVLLGFLRVSPAKYAHYADKVPILTPLVLSLCFLNILGIILVSYA